MVALRRLLAAGRLIRKMGVAAVTLVNEVGLREQVMGSTSCATWYLHLAKVERDFVPEAGIFERGCMFHLLVEAKLSSSLFSRYFAQ